MADFKEVLAKVVDGGLQTYRRGVLVKDGLWSTVLQVDVLHSFEKTQQVLCIEGAVNKCFEMFEITALEGLHKTGGGFAHAVEQLAGSSKNEFSLSPGDGGC